eukprot:1160183-Ditylum_brightwellii.AAC.1
MAAPPKTPIIYPYQALLPPPQTPLISITTPKCQGQEMVNNSFPHVILQDDPHLPAYFACSSMPVQSMKTRYSADIDYFANVVFDEESKQDLEYCDLICNPKHAAMWKHSAANEFGHLAQGAGTCIPTGTDTIHFIPKDEVPANKMSNYAQFVIDSRPQKKEIHHTRIMVR